jgi:hypothetical protein
MENELRQTLVTVAHAFVSASGCAMSTVSRRCRNDSGFFRRLSDQSKSFTARTFDEVMQWFSDNWPAGSQWPPCIDRPPVNAANTASPDSTACHNAPSSRCPTRETALSPQLDPRPDSVGPEARGVSSSCCELSSLAPIGAVQDS